MVIGSGEKDAEGLLLYIYGRDDHLGHVTQMPRLTFVPPTQEGFTQNMALIGQAVSEKMFEHCERRTDDNGQRRMP